MEAAAMPEGSMWDNSPIGLGDDLEPFLVVVVFPGHILMLKISQGREVQLWKIMDVVVQRWWEVV